MDVSSQLLHHKNANLAPLKYSVLYRIKCTILTIDEKIKNRDYYICMNSHTSVYCL